MAETWSRVFFIPGVLLVRLSVANRLRDEPSWSPQRFASDRNHAESRPDRSRSVLSVPWKVGGPLHAPAAGNSHRRITIPIRACLCILPDVAAIALGVPWSKPIICNDHAGKLARPRSLVRSASTNHATARGTSNIRNSISRRIVDMMIATRGRFCARVPDCASRSSAVNQATEPAQFCNNADPGPIMNGNSSRCELRARRHQARKGCSLISRVVDRSPAGIDCFEPSVMFPSNQLRQSMT